MTNKATKYGLMTIVAVLLVALAFAGAASATAVSGDGTEVSPFQITAADQWYSLANLSYATSFPGDAVLVADFEKFGKTSTVGNKTYLLSANYTLGNDITLKNYNDIGGSKSWNNYYGVKGFAGNFDGMGHVITLDIDMQYVVNQTKKPTDQGGIFATSLGSNVRNFTLGGDIYTINKDSPEEVWYGTDSINYGGLIGSTNGATAETAITDVDCRINFSVIFNYNTKQTWVAGIVGRTITKPINALNCSYSGVINGTVSNGYSKNIPRLNGMFGHLGGSDVKGYDRITECKFTGDINISGDVRSGDFVSYSSGKPIYNDCVSSGTVVLRDNTVATVGIYVNALAGSGGNVIKLEITGKAGEMISTVNLNHAKMYQNDVEISMPHTFSSDGEKVTIEFIPFEDDGVTSAGTMFDASRYILVNQQGSEKYLYYLSTDNREFKTSLKTDDAVSFTQKFTSMDDPLRLYTANDLLNLQKAINGDHDAINASYGYDGSQSDVQYSLAAASLRSACVVVMNDITISDPDFVGISKFSGIFDGKGHTIDYNITANTPGYYGLFHQVWGTIENLNVTAECSVDAGTATTSQTYFGGLMAYGYDGFIIKNVNMVLKEISINTDSAYCFGGLIGYLPCTKETGSYLENVKVTVTEPFTVCNGTGVTRKVGNLGGLAGMKSGDFLKVGDSVTICFNNNGSLSAYRAGGIFGYTWSDCSFTSGRFHVIGNETGTVLDGYHVGGVIGYVDRVDALISETVFKADNCIEFDGKFKLQGAATGGVIGYAAANEGTIDIANIKISGMDLSGNDVGGLIGWSNKPNCILTNCEVYVGALTSGSYHGRYIGSATIAYIDANNCVAISDNDLKIVGNQAGDFGIFKNQNTPIAGDTVEFGTMNKTMLKSSSISNVTFENVSNLTGVSGNVEFVPVNSSIDNPPARSGMQSTTLTTFEINVPGFTAGNVAEFNVTVTFNSEADATATKDSIVFWHYNTTTSQWDESPLTITATAQNGADVTYTVQTTSFSPFGIASETAIPQQYTPSSSSKQTGYTVILQEGQTAPTAYATVAPTVAPTVKPTEQPATPTVIATEKPTTQATQQSPAPFVGILAGLGVAALVLTRMRK